jgi:hypothetical protein
MPDRVDSVLDREFNFVTPSADNLNRRVSSIEPSDACGVTYWSGDAINPPVRWNERVYFDQFQSAKPFRHVVIDDFLKPEVAEALLVEYPTVKDPSSS